MLLYPSRIKQGNAGDVLINALLIKHLADYNTVLIDGSPNRELLQLLERWGVPENRVVIAPNNIGQFSTKPVLRWFNLIRYLRKLDGVFDTPGHLVVKMTFASLLKSLKDILRTAFLRTLKIQTFKIGVNIEIDGVMQVFLQKVLCRLSHVVGIRDKKNFHRLKKAGFSNIYLVDDLALLLPSSESMVKKKNNVVVSFRGAIVGDGFNEIYIHKILLKLQKTISLVVPDHHEIFLTHQVDQDKLASAYLFKNMMLPHKMQLLDSTFDVITAMAFYGRASIVLTNRLHVALLALLAGTKVCVITDMSNHAKIVDVLDSLGFGNCVIDFEDENDIFIDEIPNLMLANMARIRIVNFLEEYIPCAN